MKNIYKYIIIALPIVLLIAVVATYLWKLPTTQKQQRYGELVVEANTLLGQKQYAKSMEKYVEASELISNKVEAYEGIANILVTKNQLGQLANLLDTSTVTMSGEDRSKLYSILGNGYLNVDNYEQANRYFKNSVDFSYSNEVGKIGLAKSYLGLGDAKKALEYLDIPTNSVNFNQAYLLKLFGTLDDMTKLKEILATQPQNLNEVEKKFVADFANVTKKNADDSLYISALLGRIYVNNGYSQLAVNLLESKIDNMLEYGDGIYVLASAYHNLSRWDKVIETLNQYSNTNSNPSLYLLYARAYLNSNDATSAWSNFDSAVTASGDQLEDLVVEYSLNLVNQSQYSKAKELLDKSAKKSKDSWIDMEYLKLYVAQKDSAKAQFYVDKLAKVTTLTDSEKKVYLSLAISNYLENQKNDDANIALARLREIDGANPMYYLLSGRYNLQVANVDQAKKDLEQAIDYDLTGTVTDSAKRLLSRVN